MNTSSRETFKVDGFKGYLLDQCLIIPEDFNIQVSFRYKYDTTTGTEAPL